MQRYADNIPDKHITQTQCLSCLKSINSKNKACHTQSYSGSRCCFEGGDDIWCLNDKLKKQCTEYSDDVPEKFSKALCVNSNKCSGQKRIGIKLIHDRELKDNEEMDDGDFCSYIIEPIVTLADNDFINLKITGLDNNDATIFIVKEDK